MRTSPADILNWYESRYKLEPLRDPVIRIRPEQNLSEVAHSAAGSAIFVLDPRRYTTNQLLELNITLTNRELPTGFVFASEDEEIDFVLKKNGFALNGSSSLSIDAIFKSVFYDNEKIDFDVKRLQSLLSEGSFDVLGILAHGESSHLMLDHLVLCGCVGEKESTFSGEPVSKGCSNESCKRATANPYQALKSRNLRVRAVVGMTCHGLSVLGSHYPSDNSTAYAFQRGFASHFISSLDSQVVHANDIEQRMNFLKRGNSFGELVLDLNRKRLRNGEPPTFMLVGAPSTRWTTDNAVLIPIPETKKSPVPEQFSRWVTIAERNLSLLNWIDSVDSSSLYLHLRHLREFAGQDEMDATQALAEIRAFDENFVASAVDAFDTGGISTALVNGLRKHPFRRVQSCCRCGTELIETVYEDLMAPLSRVRSECLVCGPHSDCPIAADIQLKTKIIRSESGGMLRIHGQINFPDRPLSETYVYLSFSDKTRGGKEAFELIQIDSDIFNLDLNLPRPLGSDIHTLKAMVVSFPFLGFKRVRVLP